jgi:dGTPase
VQAVDAADSMAYNTHDVDDALKLGLLDPSDLDQLALWRDARKRVERHCAGLDAAELRGAVLQELIDLQLADLVEHTQRLLEEHDVRASDDTSSLGRLVRAGQDIGEQKRELQRFLYERVYRHPRLLAMRQTVEAILAELFEHFARRPDELPPHFQARAETAGVLQTVGDYLAGMTDRFAESEHLRVVARG